MKIRAWIVAAAIAAASGFATAPTAQACVIDADGQCLTSVVRSRPSQPSKPAKPAKHKKRHLPAKPAAVAPLPWQGPGGQGGPEGTQQPTSYDPTQNQYDPYQYGDIFGQVRQATS
ncbi:MAG: hypothetical protein ACJ76U_05805 [Gaiellaceae bacterium]|jgi:hypothetical protein